MSNRQESVAPPGRIFGLSGQEILAAGLLAAWLVAAVVAASLRPGELMEFAFLGIAGVAAWPLLVGAPTRRESVFVALLLLVPLLNSWPARVYLAEVEPSGVTASTILAPTTLVVALIVVAAPARRASGAGWLVIIGAGLVLLGAVVGTLASDATRDAGWAAISAFALPIAVGTVALASAARRDAAWRMMAALSIAAIVPAGMGLSAYALSFGAPASFDDLLVAKAALYRPFALQEVTFGNVSHLAAFALLLLPAAGAVAARGAFPLAVRLGGLAAAGLLAVDLVFVLGRAALLAFALAAFVLAGLAAFRGKRAAGALLAGGAVLAIVVAVLAGTQPSSVSGGDSGETPPAVASANFRLDAAEAGLRIAGENPLGVGTGQYIVVDPVHGAPHSLFLLVLAENSAAAATGLVLLFIAFLIAASRLARRETPDDEWLLTAGAATGVLGFAVFGAVAGAPLALGTMAVWGLLLAVLLAIVLARQKETDA